MTWWWHQSTCAGGHKVGGAAHQESVQISRWQSGHSVTGDQSPHSSEQVQYTRSDIFRLCRESLRALQTGNGCCMPPWSFQELKWLASILNSPHHISSQWPPAWKLRDGCYFANLMMSNNAHGGHYNGLQSPPCLPISPPAMVWHWLSRLYL